MYIPITLKYKVKHAHLKEEKFNERKYISLDLLL